MFCNQSEYTRIQFKEFVNHLATIQQLENGDKYLILKSKFYPVGSLPMFGAMDCGPSSLPVAYPPQRPPPAQRPPAVPSPPGFRAPPPYRPPPEPLHQQQQRRSSFTGSEASLSSVHSGPPCYPSPPAVAQQQQLRFNRQFSVPCDDFIPASAYLRDPPPERAVSIQDLTSKSRTASVQDLTDAPALPPRRKPHDTNKENMVRQ